MIYKQSYFKLLNKNRNARQNLLKQSPIALEDRFYRSLGTLKYARIITSEEAATCLSNVRLGVDLGVIKEYSNRCIK